MSNQSAAKNAMGKRGSATRAKSPFIMSLPQEVVSEIFVFAVYGPSLTHVMDVLIRRIVYIYQRVHTLLAVCTTWRRIGLACPELWTVVPLSDHLDGRRRPLSIPLSLERSGNKDLHLAMSNWSFSPRVLKSLTGHWHRFRSINLWSQGEDAADIGEALSAIMKHCSPGAVSALSLRRQETILDLFTRYILSEYEPSISRLICSLAAFRISNFSIDWSRITFTHRLVELRLADMKLRDDSEITAFLAALSSARELKELKLVSVVIALDESNSTRSGSLRTISLPKLEFLHLEHLYFNVLQFVLSVITPSCYHLTLNPLEETFFNYNPYKKVLDLANVDADEGRICAFLNSIKVHKLILWGQRRFFWSTKTGLTRILTSVPSVKTLVLNYYPTNQDTLAALKQPLGTTRQENTFPTLTRLDIHGAYVEVPLARLKPVLNEVIESHEIKHLTFGGVFVLDKRVPITKPLDDKDEVFEWLKHKVPHFTKSCEPERSPEATDMWRLWDI